MLIAALSGRSLASAAARAGYVPLVADLFGDSDTREVAAEVERVEGDLRRGLARRSLLSALVSLAGGREPEGLVCGSGFESSPRLLSMLARRWLMLGNDPAVVDRLKDPVAFAALCGEFGIAHPEVSAKRPAELGSWLVKRAGASGGGHIRRGETVRRPAKSDYWQRRVEGRAVSAAFLADGRAARIVAFTHQWTDPAPGAEFRYGGVVRLPPDDVPHRDAMVEAVEKFAALGLKGLNSADFLAGSNGCWLLEVNPRPGASLDVLTDRKGEMFHLHVEACRGSLPRKAPEYDGFGAAMVVYAARDFAPVPDISWPRWAADRQVAGTRVRAGEPLCTVLANDTSPTLAEAAARERAVRIRTMLEDDAR